MREDPLLRLPTQGRTLDNGLTVLVREDHSAPVVAVVTYVKAGYFDEPDDVVGISHVLEHMYFKGTARRGPGQIARETKDAGGYLNAGTIYDHTSYYTVLPSSSLEQALDIQADALQHSAIDADELARELQVIIQEAKRKLDNPSAVAQETLFATMFDEHRMRRWRIGTADVLERFTRADVERFYRGMYRASNTILVVAGDVQPERVFALAQQYYGGMDGTAVERGSWPQEPARRGLRYRELSGDIAQSHMEWGWRTPSALHPDTAALDVLAIAVGQGRASLLYRHVRDAGAVASVHTYNYTPGDVGVFGISAELDPRDTADAFERTAEVLHDVLAHGFTDADVERARNILDARLLRRTETAEGQANLLAEWQALGDWKLVSSYRAQALAVTREMLQDVARRYLDPDDATVLLYRPQRAQPFAADAAALRAHMRAANAPLPRSEAPVPAAPAVFASPLRPERIEDGVHFYVVDEGRARVIVKPRRTAPLVSIALYCTGGILTETADAAGITGLMARTSVKGTRQRSGVQLAEASEALGASISPGVGSDTLDWSISVPAHHFARGAALLLECALEPSFPEAEAERERKLALADLEQLRDDMYAYPMRMALATAFAGHAYGFSIAEIEAGLRSVSVEALRAWHAERVLAGAPHVFVVGDVEDADAAAAVIEAQLRGRLHAPHGAHAQTPHWPDTAQQRVEQRDKAQTAVAIAFPGPPRNHRDVHALQLLSSAISGLGGRLFEELRSRRSLAYSVTASPLARWLGGAFVAYIGTAPEREEEARTELVRELVRTTREPLDEAELERARRYLIGTWQIRQQTHGRQLADLAGAVLLGEGLKELREYEERLRAPGVEDVRAAAERWIRPERAVEGVIRGRS